MSIHWKILGPEVIKLFFMLNSVEHEFFLMLININDPRSQLFLLYNLITHSSMNLQSLNRLIIWRVENFCDLLKEKRNVLSPKKYDHFQTAPPLLLLFIYNGSYFCVGIYVVCLAAAPTLIDVTFIFPNHLKSGIKFQP